MHVVARGHALFMQVIGQSPSRPMRLVSTVQSTRRLSLFARGPCGFRLQQVIDLDVDNGADFDLRVQKPGGPINCSVKDVPPSLFRVPMPQAWPDTNTVGRAGMAPNSSKLQGSGLSMQLAEKPELRSRRPV